VGGAPSERGDVNGCAGIDLKTTTGMTNESSWIDEPVFSIGVASGALRVGAGGGERERARQVGSIASGDGCERAGNRGVVECPVPECDPGAGRSDRWQGGFGCRYDRAEGRYQNFGTMSQSFATGSVSGQNMPSGSYPLLVSFAK
jgi:hypothetical protein